MSEQTPTHPDSSTAENLPFPHFLEITRFSLRVLGIYILASASSNLVTDVAMLLLEWRVVPWKNLIEVMGDDHITTGRLIGNFLWLGAGFYFVMWGRWVIEKVFLPAGHRLAD